MFVFNKPWHATTSLENYLKMESASFSPEWYVVLRNRMCNTYVVHLFAYIIQRQFKNYLKMEVVIVHAVNLFVYIIQRQFKNYLKMENVIEESHVYICTALVCIYHTTRLQNYLSIESVIEGSHVYTCGVSVCIYYTTSFKG